MTRTSLDPRAEEAHLAGAALEAFAAAPVALSSSGQVVGVRVERVSAGAARRARSEAGARDARKAAVELGLCHGELIHERQPGARAPRAPSSRDRRSRRGSRWRSASNTPRCTSGTARLRAARSAAPSGHLPEGEADDA